MKKILLMTLMGLMAAGSTAPALALGPVDLEAELPLYSKYIWRGINAVDDYVLQPNLELGLFGFTLGLWGNLELSDVNGTSGDFTEIDYSLGYTLGLAIVELGAGFIHYNYPNAGQFNTTEFYIYGQAHVLLSPTLYIYQDIDRFKGAYWAASIGHGIKVGESNQIDLTAGLGLGSENYIEGYFPVDPTLPWEPEFSTGASSTDYFIDAKVPFHPIPFLTIAPSITWTSLLGDAKKSVDAVPDDSVFSGKTSNFYWGLSASFSF